MFRALWMSRMDPQAASSAVVSRDRDAVDLLAFSYIDGCPMNSASYLGLPAH